jgi:hypothetical protein
MGKAKRCRAVVVSAGVAALAGAAACPAANGASNPPEPAAARAVASPPSDGVAPPGVARAARVKPRHAGDYVYTLRVVGMNRLGENVSAVCNGSNAVIPGTLVAPDSANTSQFFADPNAYHEQFNVHTDASTKLAVTGTHPEWVHSLCAINETFGARGDGAASPGPFTWRLSRRARTLAELLQHPASGVAIVTEGES